MGNFGAGRSTAAALLILNFGMYMIVLGLAGWVLNRGVDYSQANIVNRTGAVFSLTRFPVGNAATPFFIVFALSAGVLGIASVLAGVNHVGLWRTESLAAAAASALIGWLVTLLAFGLACKEINLGGPFRNRRMKTLEAFVIILAGTQLLYLVVLHSGMAGDRLGPRFREPGGGLAGVEQPKGGSAASAV